VLDLALAHEVGGIIATNTTTTREGLGSPHLDETGGLSGVPLRARSTQIIRHIYRQTGGRLPIIGVGGIFTGDDAWEKLAAGASLLQAYTGFIYQGPAFVRQVTARLRVKMREAGVNSLSEIVGASAK
jgi:dihydroorotate dehydrogenase